MIRVYLGIRDETSGPYIFMRRLRDALISNDRVEVVNSPNDCDVALSTIQGHYPNCKNVLRLDGVYFDSTEDWKEKNKPIKESYVNADGVVFQSKYSLRLCVKYLGPSAVPSDVIYNGIDLDYIDHIKPLTLSCKTAFLCTSKWRPFKRLPEMVEAFKLASIPNSKLFVAGDITKCGVSKETYSKWFTNHPIDYLGVVKPEKLLRYVKSCDVFIHLSWLDSCPNSVVEAIGCGKPVICSNFSGTKEVVGWNGYVCGLDDEAYDLSPRDLSKVPSIDLGLVADIMKQASKKKLEVNRVAVDIKGTANRYIDLFERVCSG